MTSGQAISQIVFQRDGGMLVSPGGNRADVAAAVRLCGQLETITAGSYLFKLNPVAIWGSAARGLTVDTILDRLDCHAATPVPAQVAALISRHHARYGVIWIERSDGEPARLRSSDPSVLARSGLGDCPELRDRDIPQIKQQLASEGWPVVDRYERQDDDELAISWRPGVELRPYQIEAVSAHLQAGNGLVLLPCGAGKTMVGVGVAVDVRTRTLILAPSREIADQWERTLVETTTVNPEDVSVAVGDRKPTPITITTYHSASTGRVGSSLAASSWGLVIYDEVQSLPANVFRAVSAFSAVRRLGLSATLVREDGREAEIFAMVGPVVYDVPWVELERDGWIAPAQCHEVRIPEAPGTRQRQLFKHAVIERILSLHEGKPALIVGSRIQWLESVARRFDVPVLTGKDDPATREETFEAFRTGRISRLAVSRIGSVGLDLPTAELMIQVDGNFGSRQEEAQRLGRLLRPGDGQPVHFYSLVSLGTREPKYARRRQRFLVNQGYEYEILDAADLPRVARAGVQSRDDFGE
ncbi:MAG: helicase-associated domain-containing protein [Thermomicrobiales bacterium]